MFVNKQLIAKINIDQATPLSNTQWARKFKKVQANKTREIK